jgi:hypothetical protein
MARRRALSGRPLLLASGGLALACHHPTPPDTPVGNLMAPVETVTADVCVDVTPEGAAVLVNGVQATERCTTVTGSYGDRVAVEVSAPTYEIATPEVTLVPELPPITVNLVPLGLLPVGNLMSPQ